MNLIRKYAVFLSLALMSVLLGACNPNVATPAVKCTTAGVCTITVKNEENHPVKYRIDLGYEPQGRPIVEVFRPHPEGAPAYHDYWALNVSNFFSKDGTLATHETITFVTTLPKEFKELPGYSLLQLRVQLDPHGWNTEYGRYYAYTAYVVNGPVDRPVEYELDCSGGTANITIINNGEWGDLNFAAYLNENLDDPWEKFTVKANDRLTITTKPFPADARLLELDVEGHQADTNWDGVPDLLFHESRGMCIPNTPILTLKLPVFTPFNPENR